MPAGGAQSGNPVSSVIAIGTAARAYLARGWSVVPVEPRGKRPLVRWTAFQLQTAEPMLARLRAIAAGGPEHLGHPTERSRRPHGATAGPG